jgi:D-lyxose ketol-isomerase
MDTHRVDPSNSLEMESALADARSLIHRSGLILSAEENAALQANDFGLGRFRTEGFVFVDLLRSERIRITLLILLSNQTLPEHLHPAYGKEPGKEETLRCLWGETRVVVPGSPTPGLRIPAGKESVYHERHAVMLCPGEQYTLPPGTRHWFQAGPKGSVNLAFQNRVDETQNIFSQPNGVCPVPT